MTTALLVEVLEDSEQFHRVRLSGELDISEAPALVSLLLDLAHSPLVVDLAGLTFIDSQGVNAFVRLRKGLTERGDELRLVGAPPSVHRVFELLGMGSWLSEE